MIWRKPIIVADPTNERPFRQSHRMNKVVQKAHVDAMTVIDNASIGPTRDLGISPRLIRPRVVANDELEVLVTCPKTELTTLARVAAPLRTGNSTETSSELMSAVFI